MSAGTTRADPIRRGAEGGVRAGIARADPIRRGAEGGVRAGIARADASCSGGRAVRAGTTRADPSRRGAGGGVRAGIARAKVIRSDAERGSGTVLAVALGVVVIICMVAALMLAQAAAMAQRAATAADLAALAAADAARGLTVGEPCFVASETAARHGASLTACTVDGGEIVDIRTELIRGTFFGTATGRSRAGPPP